MADPPCPRPSTEQLCFAGSAARMSCTEAPQQPQPVAAGATTIALGPAGHHQGSTEGDLECLVCREPYNYARSPKLLSCQHSFCAVCLKLLLCVQEDTWSITCPLCRKITVVPGGLICSLRDQEAVMGRLAGLCVEVQLCPQGLQRSATSRVGYPGLAGEDEQDAVTANRVAARRLAVHLLLLVLLIILILPFIYPGIIRWVLAMIIALALLIATLFCCYSHNQGSCWPCPRTHFCREQKHSQIASIA
ncbi:RING finger protein 186 [Octodon degus]|uniref:RING-type E3 ubiquitin transferase n=1 Tax=Octodon degus TaxID=10160 RepID=A0A6P6F1L5_OCTDE|nr:RING finger protein 186 [Octodon degus]XP_023578361.1 RING finger protein 186 [Octodon degus]XP_023578362.1 RING finger protein 186 [Octodon degus]XP_023578363.1 RING finger protein 186 [Octodon degus]